MSLTRKRLDFIENYLINFDPTDAAKRAGYSNPKVKGRALLKNTDITTEIQESLKSDHMSSTEALSRASRMARTGNIEALRLIFNYHGLNEET